MTSSLERTRTFQTVALCLEYPDAAWRARLPLLGEAAATLHRESAAALGRFLAWATSCEPDELERRYVETFDLQRRCCPYLTYYAFGDTRKRGMALLKFTQAYRREGFEIASNELPDHLSVVCEFAARSPEAGVTLMRDHRAGIELLSLALSDTKSPWADVLVALRAALPDAAPHDLARALDLARSGPPAEEVGLEPFAPPEYMGARR